MGEGLRIRFGCDTYEHFRALFDGRVKAEGIDLACEHMGPAVAFERLLVDGTLDVAEFGLTFFLSTMTDKTSPFIALPVFPSRSFRHSCIYVSSRSNITRPEQLVGRRIGELHSYGHDAGVWAKGVLSGEYGLPPKLSQTYFVGGVTRPHHAWRWLPTRPPADITVHQVEHTTLDAMLVDGEIDALISAHAPPSLLSKPGAVRRLFENSEQLEREYYERTKIFPIMHAIVMRRSFYEENRWIARVLYDACKKAKALLNDYYLSQEAQLHRFLMIPWLAEHMAENRRLLGDDPWPYGIKSNLATLKAFVDHHCDQGLSERRFDLEELFAPETMDD